MNVDLFVLEFATLLAGDLAVAGKVLRKNHTGQYQ
jgi:hypothetical protein